MCCPLVFEFSVGIGGFVIGLGQISFFFYLLKYIYERRNEYGRRIFYKNCIRKNNYNNLKPEVKFTLTCSLFKSVQC